MGFKPLAFGLLAGDSPKEALKNAIGETSVIGKLWSDREKDKADEIAKAAEEAKALQAAKAARYAQASGQGMKKGGAVKSKRYDAGGSVYTEKMGKPPQDVDGASVRKQSKRDQPEQLGEGIRVEKKAKGGMTGSSASKRADGCACRGKTRGKMY